MARIEPQKFSGRRRPRGLLDRVVALDRRAALAGARLRRPWLSPLILAVSYSGTGPVWFGSSALLVLALRLGFDGIPRLELLLGAMTGAFFSLVCGQLLKRVFRRPRPFEELPGHTTVGRRPRDGSLPSTHASTSVALALGLVLYGHPLSPFAAAWSALVVFSRHYLGVHYLSDLVAGALLGGLFGLFDWRFVVRALVFPEL